MTDSNDSNPLVVEEILDEADTLLERGASAGTHQAKVVALSNLMEEIFGTPLVDILPGIEEQIGSSILGLSGRIDLLYDNVIFEVKTDFDSERSDAISKLQSKYFPALLDEYPDRRYIGLITDLEQFEIVRPVVKDGEIVDVATIDSLDSTQESIQTSLFWLDSAIFSGNVKVPTADELKRRYGPNTPTYELAVEDLSEMWEQFREENESDPRLNLWTRMMEIVYGSAPDEDAFIAQTYLSVLVKLLVRLRLEPSIPTRQDQYVDIINGDYFEDYGINNLIEEDFYTWILDESVRDDAISTFDDLARALNVYNLDLAKEDLFKEVYQEIVALNQRHGTGEYYTPRWLCEYTLSGALEEFGEEAGDFPRLLDPACGSGGFLTEAIYSLLDRSTDLSDQDQVDLVIENIQGIDVNPLAVIIARANYAIALGDLLKSAGEITIPVFASDSINLPDLRPSLHNGVNCYAIEAEGRSLMIPAEIASETDRRMEVLNVLGETIHHYRDSLNQDQAKAFFDRHLPNYVSDDETNILNETVKDLIQFVDNGKDHIWIYVLNNFYAPTMLRNNPFELLIGNPPWIVMRSISNDTYQNFLKSEIQEYDLLDSDRIELFTHMEMSTLFFRKTADVYLENGGQLAYIMPISVTSGAFQHQKFNNFDNPVMKLYRVSSFREVSEIFSLPPCVLFAKKGEATEYPVEFIQWEGSISNLPRNVRWTEVNSALSSSLGEYSPAEAPTEQSPYYEKFGAGTTINPRNFFYVEFQESDTMGFNPDRPLVRTSADLARVAGKKWKDIILEGRVESEFIHASYLGKDCIPFGRLPPRPVVLPSLVERGERIVLDGEGLRNRGFPNTAEWIDKAQYHWEENRTDKSEERFPSIIDRINYHGDLTDQDPENRYVVFYNGRGADSFASVLDRENLPTVNISGNTLEFADFIADQTNYYYETNDLNEAHYLCAILNSHEIHKAVKPFQPEGQYGPRDIGRRMFRFPIPEFESSDASHTSLAKKSKDAHEIVQNIDFDPDDGFRRRRNITNEKLDEVGVIAEIDKIILSLGITGATIEEE